MKKILIFCLGGLIAGIISMLLKTGIDYFCANKVDWVYNIFLGLSTGIGLAILFPLFTKYILKKQFRLL